MTHLAYQNARRISEDPRQIEYRLFGEVTGALIDAGKNSAKGTPLAEAIGWNRRLWRTLAADCLNESNQLPKELRAQIVSLALWVSRYSKQVTRGGAPIDPLVEVNRTIMEGLRGAA